MSKKIFIGIVLALVIISAILGLLVHGSALVHRAAIIDGEKEISQIVEQTKNITDPKEKIEQILVFLVDDYYQTYSQFKLKLWIYEIYPDISFEGIRFYLRSDRFCNDPYWIAHYNAGACHELAILFNETVTRAGFNSRIVYTNAEDHVWNEVFLDEQWVHVDPTLYYHYYRNGWNFSNSWFDTPEIYQGPNFWHNGYSQVFVLGTNQDISKNYLKMGNLSLITSDNVDKIVIKPVTFARDIELPGNTSTCSISLGEKEYFIKTIIFDSNPIFVYEDSGYATVRENETTVLYLESPTKILYWPMVMTILCILILLSLFIFIYYNILRHIPDIR